MELIEFVRRNKLEKCPWSRERAQHIDDWGMALAVKGGFRFERGDFGEPGSGINEGLYAAAILEGNMSAVHAMEYAAKRKPFITRDIRPSSEGPQMAHMAGQKDQGRLAVGFSFRWDGRWVKVTSFAYDSSYLVACAYPENNYHNVPACDTCGQRRYDLCAPKANKPDKVYKITVEDLKAGRAAWRKKHPKCKLCLKPAPEGQEICGREHQCERWNCKKVIRSLTEGKRVSMWDGSPKRLLCNECAAREGGA
jgi:hypothetical protein